MIQKVLESIGLNSKEILVYLTALDVGTQPASVISRRVNIPRNTTRFLLDKLTDKGLIKKSTRANTQLYTPEEPKNLIHLLERERVNANAVIDKKIEQLKEAMVEFETRHHPQSTKPKVTFYEGDEGLVKVYEDTLTSSETIRSFASFDDMHDVLSNYFKTYYSRRAENKILIRSIHPDTPLAREKTKNDKKEWRDSRLIPAKEYSFTPEIQFYDHKVVITSFQEKLGIMIESEEIYKAMVVAFELAWKEAGRLDKRKN